MSVLSSAFNFGKKQLRVYGTPDKPWFCGKDVCEILEYKRPTDAVNEHVDNEYIKVLSDIMKVGKTPSLKGNLKNLKLINEQGLYCLIFNSKMERAKLFRKWVFEEVLPSIRKNGHYVDKNITSKQIEELKQQLKVNIVNLLMNIRPE